MQATRLALAPQTTLAAALALLALAVGCQPLTPKAPEEATATEAELQAAAPAPSPHAQDEEAARERAKAWLALLDAGQYAESWDAAADLFKASMTQERWAGAAEGARSPLGALTSRELRAAEYKTSLEGAPEGEYVVVHFDSAFAQKPKAREIVTLTKQADGSWHVVGYFVE